MHSCVVFDIGGTSLRTGLYSPDTDRVSAVKIRATPNHLTFPAWSGIRIQERLVEDIADAALEQTQGEAPRVIGLALPGPIDGAGNLGHIPTILGPKDAGDLPFVQRLQERLPGTHFALQNDVAAAGYGLVEQDSREFCLITISSGIGHKVFVDGEPVVGIHGAGGELGHWRVDAGPDAPRCECGGYGHLAAVASGRAVLHRIRQAAAAEPRAFRQSRLFALARGRAEQIENPAIVAAFHAHDEWVTQLLTPALRAMGQAIAAVHLIVGTERFVIMGGFGEALGTRFCRMLSSAAADFAWGAPGQWEHRVCLAPPDRSIALLGAGRLACRNA